MLGRVEALLEAGPLPEGIEAEIADADQQNAEIEAEALEALEAEEELQAGDGWRP